MLTFVMLIHLIIAALVGIAGTIWYMKDKAVISSGPSATMGLYWKTFIFFFLPAYFILYAIGTFILKLLASLGLILAIVIAIGAIYVLFIQKEELTELIEKKYIGAGLLVISLGLFFVTGLARDILGETTDNSKPSYTQTSSASNQSYNQSRQQEERKPATYNANNSASNNNPQQSGATMGNQHPAQPQYVSPTKYINLIDQYNKEISTLASDVNNYLSQNANFQNDHTFLSRAESISRHIYGTKEEIRTANIKNLALKQKLSEVFEALQGRVDGLLDGIRTSKNGGDYTPGFQRGGNAFDRFEEADKALKQMVQ